ncbi:MAG: hypothetical protein KKB70_04180 [Proteobacteria bacterium]|nr:hypothetical protein [Pseudomonadota bacterium]
MFITPAVLIMLICTVVILILPSVYKAQSVVLIETQEISDALVQSQFTGLIEERLRSLNQKVLSRSTMLDLINEYELYDYLLTDVSSTELAEIMRDDINVEMVTTEVHDAATVRTGVATYAFTLSFMGRNPGKVLKVANRLLSMYLEEDSRQRESQSQSTMDFLNQRVSEVDSELAQAEAEFSEFKRENRYTLPEMLGVNLEAQQRLETAVMHTDDQIFNVNVRYKHWLSELANTPKFIKVQTTGGVRLLTAEEQLDRLRRDYVELISSNSEDHPDVVKLSKQIRALEEQARRRQDLDQYSEDLARKEDELAEAKELYSDSHPDVLRLTAEVTKLHEDIRTISERYMIQPKAEELELNPQWVHAKNQVEANNTDLNQFQMEREGLANQLKEYMERITQTSETELRYNVLNQHLNALKNEKDQLTQQMMSAKSAKGMDDSGLGEKFVVVDPPVLPVDPDSPNRPLLLILALFVSLGAGAFVGTMAEVTDRTAHTAEDLARHTKLPILASIPMLGEVTPGRFSSARAMSMVMFMLIAIVALIVFHYLVLPLDSIFEKFFILIGLY